MTERIRCTELDSHGRKLGALLIEMIIFGEWECLVLFVVFATKT